MKKTHLLSLLVLCFMASTAFSQAQEGGASQSTPSRSEYFSWINNTNEGATEAQTLANLEFFRYLRDRYGMQLDIYAFDAGAIDGSKRYGTTDSEDFKRHFPNGFAPISLKAKAMGTKLGVWGGPDGFGDTPQQAKARADMMVGLVRDYGFGLFKMDGVCGPLRPEKYAEFDSMMTRIRRINPSFVLLNHRLELGPGNRHSTTFLLGGAETYIDVHMTNSMTAPHHRGEAISRKAPEDLTRLTEDHGVCISSCLDFWEDDLVLQAFGRELILAPEIYANPWFLRDDEFSYLAFLFNLHRDYRDILPSAVRLDMADCGPEALSRGDGATRFVTLRNLTWKPATYRVPVGSASGLKDSGGKIKARLYHPYIMDLGDYSYGDFVEVEVRPFRTALLKLTSEPERDKVALSGIPYQIVSDRTGGKVEIRLLGMPGQSYRMRLSSPVDSLRSASLDGRSIQPFLKGRTVRVDFPGTPLKEDYHRHLASMTPAEVPQDAAALYDATCFAADNNAMEVRSLTRSGATAIPEVQAAREAFLSQEVFLQRECSDRNLFDSDLRTAFSVAMKIDPRVDQQSGFYLDLGAETKLDSLVMSSFDEHSLSPYRLEEGALAYISSDLRTWRQVTFIIRPNSMVPLKDEGTFRFLKLSDAPMRLSEITGYRDGKSVDRSLWRASNLFRTYGSGNCKAKEAWVSRFTITEASVGSYLCIAVEGEHGREGAWAALKMDGKYIGCPDRAPSFQANPWEHRLKPVTKNLTYYVPVTGDMVGKSIEAWVLSLDKAHADLRPEVYLTAYPIPFEKRDLVFQE